MSALLFQQVAVVLTLPCETSGGGHQYKSHPGQIDGGTEPTWHIFIPHLKNDINNAISVDPQELALQL